MTPSLQNHLSQELKAYLASIQDSGLVFSYTLGTSFSSEGMSLVLQQKETDFTLSMEWQEKGDRLLIKSFALKDNKQLENLSSALYDVAGLEIVLQALDLLFFLAEQQDLNTALFILNNDEANHLTPLEGFFKSLSSQSIMGSRKVTLTLPTTLDAYDLFVDQAENIKTKIQQQLWQEQTDDYCLRGYLQSHKKGESFSLKDLIPQETKPLSPMGQIIVFPKFAKRG
ncbi:hypothetical protein [Candidatus Paracaedibacter symbiosus]|uniref:hypothetical protein n=1 Tax=Candidatus Paracaedibacter symbiosus TaxID=244582 RepID=UPI0005096A9F|nr:hypothetical protein [Candidatus Paracaedibacter symbiosus]